MERKSSFRKAIVQAYKIPQSDSTEVVLSQRSQAEPPRELKEFSVKRRSLLLKMAFCFLLFSGFQFYAPLPAETNLTNVWGVEKEHVAESISSSIRANEYPEKVQFKIGEKMLDAVVRYNIEPEVKEYIDSLLQKYQPDYAAVVAIQPDTGRILALSSFVRGQESFGNLAVHSEFPAASIFKIITAAAAIDQGIANPKTTYQYNGKNTSLYKKNVLRHKKNKWTRETSLSYAFARSINTVFGRIGVFDVGGTRLAEYAEYFGFNKSFPLDISVESSKTRFDPANEWAIAEAASGYTNTTTISPLHAAMMVSAIVNDGVMIEPSLIEFAHHPDGPLLYESNQNSYQTVESETAQNMRVLMRETVKKGSARKSFRGFFKGNYAKLDVGGKTGSLSGNNPKGRTEWFVGYGDSGFDRVVIAAVVVNKEKWRVKPSYLARKIIEEYFKQPPPASRNK